MIKRHKTLLLLGNFRSNLKGLWCQDGRTAHGPLSSFGGPSDVTLPASRGDGDLVGMLWYCCVSWGKHLLLSRPQFPHLSRQPRVKGEGRQFLRKVHSPLGRIFTIDWCWASPGSSCISRMPQHYLVVSCSFLDSNLEVSSKLQHMRLKL